MSIVEAESVYALQLPMYINVTINGVTLFHLGDGLFISEQPLLTVFERIYSKKNLIDNEDWKVITAEIDNPLAYWRDGDVFRAIVKTITPDEA